MVSGSILLNIVLMGEKLKQSVWQASQDACFFNDKQD
jgi:hypothetical protein